MTRKQMPSSKSRDGTPSPDYTRPFHQIEDFGSHLDGEDVPRWEAPPAPITTLVLSAVLVAVTLVAVTFLQ